jgi:hypothetical protein
VSKYYECEGGVVVDTKLIDEILREIGLEHVEDYETDQE